MTERPLRVAMMLADERDVMKRHALPRPYFGPAQAALLEGLENLPGLEVHILSCEHADVAHTPKLAENFFFHPVRISRLGYLRSFYLETIFKVRSLVRRFAPDLAHGQGTERYQALAAAFSGKPSLITIHGNMRAIARILKQPLLSFYGVTGCLESVAVRKADGVICNSKYTRNEVAAIAKRTWDAPNAIASQYFAPLAGERDALPRILNIGYIGPRKRQVELLQEARKLFEAGFKFRLEFIGDLEKNNEYGGRFFELVSAAEREGWARHLGFLEKAEIIRIMGEARGFIHVPEEEAFGLVVAESIARGLKSFLFAEGGVRDIGTGVPGVQLLEPGDWAGLIDSVAGWLRAGAPPEEGGCAVMRERYSPASVAQRTLTIYREMLAAAK